MKHKAVKNNSKLAITKFRLIPQHSKALALPLASQCKEQPFKDGLQALAEYGIAAEAPLDPTCVNPEDGIRRTAIPTKKASIILVDALLAREPSPIIVTRGGYGSMRILPKLNYKRLFKAKTVNPLVGFSDITALSLGLYKTAKIQSIHGAMVAPNFGKSKENSAAKISCDALVELLRMGTCQAWTDYPLKPELHVKAKPISGPLIGGNLTVIGALCGTSYLPNFAGHILMLEDIGEELYRLHRTLTQLIFANVFEGVKAIVIGALTNCSDSNDPSINQLTPFLDLLAPLKIPVFSGAPFGHEALNLPWVQGGFGVIRNQKLSIENK